VYPEAGGAIYNKTGKREDNFWIKFSEMRLHRCMPPDDWTEMQKELQFYREIYGRPGDLWVEQSITP
jgi:hypothetical protein